MSENVRKLCVTAMGVALFVVLSMCLQVPVFDNYYLCLGYVVMTVYCYSFGAGMGTAASCTDSHLFSAQAKTCQGSLRMFS